MYIEGSFDTILNRPPPHVGRQKRPWVGGLKAIQTYLFIYIYSTFIYSFGLPKVPQTFDTILIQSVYLETQID